MSGRGAPDRRGPVPLAGTRHGGRVTNRGRAPMEQVSWRHPDPRAGGATTFQPRARVRERLASRWVADAGAEHLLPTRFGIRQELDEGRPHRTSWAAPW